jgi:hypothetical protein
MPAASSAVSAAPRALFSTYTGDAVFGAPDSNVFPQVMSDSSASEFGSSNGPEIFSKADLASLGLGSPIRTPDQVAIHEIGASLKYFPVPSFPASSAVEIHPLLLKKTVPLADKFVSAPEAFTLMLAASACRSVSVAEAIIAHASASGIRLTSPTFERALDIAIYRSDKALFDAALKLYDATFDAAKRHATIESARVAFLQRTGDADGAFQAYSAGVAAGVLKKPWRTVYAKTLRTLTPRLAVEEWEPKGAAEVKADRVRADAIVLHEPHPESNFAAWRYAMRALRGDLDLSFPGADIRIPQNLVIDIATAGVRAEFKRTLGGKALLRRRRNLLLGYIKATGRQMPVSIRSRTSLFYIPKAEVERVVLSERHFLPSERKRLAEVHEAAVKAKAQAQA